MKYYIQCLLNKDNRWQVAWVPEKHAKKNNHIEILGEDGWKVISTHSKRDSNENNGLL